MPMHVLQQSQIPQTPRRHGWMSHPQVPGTLFTTPISFSLSSHEDAMVVHHAASALYLTSLENELKRAQAKAFQYIV
eukprot:453101-Pelagomonas_calceolata.AAC.2